MIEDYIKLFAEKQPQKIAIICDRQKVTYAQLYDKIKQRTAEICQRFATNKQQQTSQSSHRAIVFRSSQTIDFLVTYFAIHLSGNIAVPLEKDATEEIFSTIQKQVEHMIFPKEVADILFTTGTTGKSKGIMISHRAILANADNLKEAQGFNKDLVFIISGPLNHIGSLSKVYPTLMCGATLYLLQGMKDLNAFYTALDYPCSKMATFLVPTNIRILLTFSSNRLHTYAHKIDFIETGASAISQKDLDLLRKTLPTSRLYNTYASTETGIIATYNFNTPESKANCLGKAMKHSHFFITAEGRIACQGDTLMLGYVGDEEMTRLVLNNGTIYTSDNGEIDSEGRLHMLGRQDDVINIGGYKVAPTEVEDVALSLPDIKECICIAAEHPVIGVVTKLLIVSEKDEIDKKSIARFIANKLESYKVPIYYEKVDKIERTFNGKLNRKYYR